MSGFHRESVFNEEAVELQKGTGTEMAMSLWDMELRECAVYGPVLSC